MKQRAELLYCREDVYKSIRSSCVQKVLITKSRDFTVKCYGFNLLIPKYYINNIKLDIESTSFLKITRYLYIKKKKYFKEFFLPISCSLLHAYIKLNRKSGRIT